MVKYSIENVWPCHISVLKFAIIGSYLADTMYLTLCSPHYIISFCHAYFDVSFYFAHSFGGIGNINDKIIVIMSIVHMMPRFKSWSVTARIIDIIVLTKGGWSTKNGGRCFPSPFLCCCNCLRYTLILVCNWFRTYT